MEGVAKECRGSCLIGREVDCSILGGSGVEACSGLTSIDVDAVAALCWKEL
jgi:hypothetical protein